MIKSISKNSEIRNGVPWTNDDERLFTDLSEQEQKKILKWIKANIIPSKTAGCNYSSYGIKHLLEADEKIYTTNNQFKHAMMLAGYNPVEENKLNWTFYISRRSPAFNLKKRGYLC